MINITVRQVSDHQDVTLDVDGVIVPVGFLSEQESIQLAISLLSSVEDLLPSSHDHQDALQQIRESL